MSTGKRRRTGRAMLIAVSELSTPAAHPFYRRLNGIFTQASFDAFVEGQCAKFYTHRMGRPSLAPSARMRATYFGG